MSDSERDDDATDEDVEDTAKMMAAGMALLELANENGDLKHALRLLVLAVDKLLPTFGDEAMRIVEGPLHIAKRVLKTGR